MHRVERVNNSDISINYVYSDVVDLEYLTFEKEEGKHLNLAKKGWNSIRTWNASLPLISRQLSSIHLFLTNLVGQFQGSYSLNKTLENSFLSDGFNPFNVMPEHKT